MPLGEWARQGKIDEDTETTKTTKDPNNSGRLDDYDTVYHCRTPIIFYSIATGVIFLGIIPWIVGWVKIFQWIF